MLQSTYYIGCAGWSISGTESDKFPTGSSHLERYAGRFPAVEINSSFYRPHRPTTYERWASTVPDDFLFAVKTPKEITHTRRLKEIEAPLDRFLGEIASLGDRLGPILVQLPPTLRFDQATTRRFLATVRKRTEAHIVCEPRHATWFTAEAASLLIDYRVSRVAADPALVPEAAVPGGWTGLAYYRLHGSPRMYHSAYSSEYIALLARSLRTHIDQGQRVWCIFDNTASFAAIPNALQLLDLSNVKAATPYAVAARLPAVPSTTRCKAGKN